jgi:gluconolactonase
MKTGAITVLTDRYEGRRYNSPNDLCVDGAGRIWFTDPRYGDRAGMELSVEGVYRIDPDDRVALVLDQNHVQKPNGIAVAPDGKMLYVVDANDEPGGNRKVWGFEISPAGTLGNRRLIWHLEDG